MICFGLMEESSQTESQEERDVYLAVALALASARHVQACVDRLDAGAKVMAQLNSTRLACIQLEQELVLLEKQWLGGRRCRR